MPAAELPSVPDLAVRLGGQVTGPKSIRCLCPIHEADNRSPPHNPSCIVLVARGQLIVHCQSRQCDKKDWPAFKAALAAKADIEAGLVGARRGTGPDGIKYHYYWPDGTYSWSKLKTVTPAGRKSFKTGVWNEAQGWVSWGRPINSVPLYGLRELAQAMTLGPDTLVLIVEGEKDTNTAQALKLPATSAADGGRWSANATAFLERLGVKRVCIIPDNDAPGIGYGIRVADALVDVGITVHWLELPGLAIKGDLTDWVEAGGTRERLDALLAGAPEYDPNILQWRGRLKEAGFNSTSMYRGANDSHNIGLVLQYHEAFRGAFRFNSFRQRIEVTKDLPWRPLGERLTVMGYRAREDSDITNLGAWAIDVMDFGPFQVDTLDRAMKAEAAKASFDEAVIWLERVPAWDGVRRLDSFLQDYFCARVDSEDPARSAAYLAMVAYMLFGQVVRRIHYPGCQADHSILLYGNQGDGKDKALRALFGEYLSESPPSLRVDRAADRARTMAGYLLIHDAEMASFGKATDAERKAALTRSHDKGRAAYARELEDVPRRAPWAFSGNIRGVLGDPTGDRRIWPAEVEREITDEAVDKIREVAPQLWAEARARVAANEPDWPHTAERKELLLWGQSTFRPEAFGDLEEALDRYLEEDPLWAKPAPGDIARGWMWKARPAPLTALTIGHFFARVYGQVVGVGGGPHAELKNVTLVTVYLRRLGWTLGKVRAWDVIAHEDERRSHKAWRAPGPPETASQKVPGSRNPGRKARSGTKRPRKDKGHKAGSVKAEKGGIPDPGTFSRAQIRTKRHENNDLGLPQLVPGSVLANSTIVKTFENHENRVDSGKIPLMGNSRKATPGPIKAIKAELFMAPVEGSDYASFSLEAVPVPEGVGNALVHLYQGAGALAIDLETTGLNAECDRIRTVQFCDGKVVAVIVWSRPVSATQAFASLADFLRSKRLVAHPARFEGAWLQAAGLGDIVLDDTALLWAAVHGGGNPWKKTGSAFSPIALRDLAFAVLGIELDKSEQLSDWSADVLSASQLKYAALDAVVTAFIWSALARHAVDRESKSGLDIGQGYDDLRKSNALALQMERNGVKFDLAAHEAWTKGAAAAAAPVRARLEALEPGLDTGSPHKLGLAVARRLEALEPQAARQARRFWPRTKAARLALLSGPPRTEAEKEKARTLSFSKDSLETVLAADGLTGELRELVQALYELKDITGRLNLFGEGFRKHVDPKDGRLRGSFFAAGAVTGRYVSQNPNLQNIFKEFRAYLIAPAGRLLVCADYSQLELRVLASISRCPGMTQAFARGEDYHNTVAKLAGVDRLQAKRINFGLVYGQGVDALARELGVEPGEAADYLDRWAKGAPGAWDFLSGAPERYKRDGGIATVRRWIDAPTDADAASKAGTRPRNYPIQGAAGDVLHLAMARLLEEIPGWPGNVLPLLTIHDEIVLECDQDVAEAVGARLVDVMTRAFAEILPGGPVLHLAFGGIGKDWLSAKNHGDGLEKAARALADKPKGNGRV